MGKKPYYITTPIYYPSDKLHIGHSYTTVAADTMARYKRMRGYDVMFLTGTDEHGQKIEKVAMAKGTTPKAYVDNIVDWIKDLWKTMDISYDKFIRTTDKEHEVTVQKIFKELFDKGDIYKGAYEGWYCTPCESFYTETQLEDGKCPDCGRAVDKIKEEAYFFKLSKYQDQLIEHIETHDEFIQPKTRQNEMLNNFLRPGLEDLCVSRTSFEWGIPVEFDEGHVVYVWLDALSNYISALGYSTDQDEKFNKYWPADVHLVGKEIVRFHTIIWPAMLMALNVPLPKQVFGHGWLVINGGKMSKSKGNVVDPKILVDRYGSDAIRYFLMREVAFGQDGNFTNEVLIKRINADLANDLGNLVSRTVAMINKYFGDGFPTDFKATDFDTDIETKALETVKKVEDYMEQMLFSKALDEIWNLVRRSNKYIDETRPWILAKDDDQKDVLANVLYHLTESLRMIAVMIEPFMPHTPKIMREQLGIKGEELVTWNSLSKWGMLPKEISVQPGNIIFPRIDMVKELESLENAQKAGQEKPKEEEVEEDNLITFEDFTKVEMKVGEVIECNKVEGADKLLVSKIKIGNEVRQIVSGIAKSYTPGEMIGKKVIVVMNLKPIKLRGVLSEGMILAASNKKNLTLATVDGDINCGATVS